MPRLPLLRRILPFVALAICVQPSLAPAQDWFRGYGQDERHESFDVLRTLPQGGIIGLGMVHEDEWKPYLVKLNAQGYSQWERIWGEDGVYHRPEDLVVLGDGGFVAVGKRGQAYDTQGGEFFRFDAFGNQVSHVVVGGVVLISGIAPWGSGFLLSGTGPHTGLGGDVTVVAVDSLGGELWRQSFPEFGDVYSGPIRRLPNGEYLCGFGRTGELGLAHLSHAGDVLAHYTYTDQFPRFVRDLILVPEGAVAVTESVDDPGGGMLIRVGLDGDALWSRVYPEVFGLRAATWASDSTLWAGGWGPGEPYQHRAWLLQVDLATGDTLQTRHLVEEGNDTVDAIASGPNGSIYAGGGAEFIHHPGDADALLWVHGRPEPPYPVPDLTVLSDDAYAVLPPGGGSVSYGATLRNPLATPHLFQLTAAVIPPSGIPQPVASANLTLAPFAEVTHTGYGVIVPPSALSGHYAFVVRLAPQGDAPRMHDSFVFAKQDSIP